MGVIFGVKELTEKAREKPVRGTSLAFISLLMKKMP